jgi:hypothetical protein
MHVTIPQSFVSAVPAAHLVDLQATAIVARQYFLSG